MACKHILIDVMPDLNNLLPKTIYFVKENQLLLITDENGNPTTIGGGEKQTFGYEFSVGNFYLIGGYYMVSHQDSGVTSTSMSKISVNTDIEAISHAYTKGKIVEKTGLKVKSLFGYIRIGSGVDVRLIVGRKHYLPDGTLQSEVISATSQTLTNGGRWNIDINSDVAFENGDEIVLIIDARGLSGNKKAYQLYNKIITE